ncbi:MAG: UrcA family protein [Gammaproteobacteria bacterium]
MNILRTTIALSLCLSGVGLAPAATSAGQLATIRAAEPYAAPEKTVDYSDLNLKTRKGAAVLYARLHNAAAVVCDRVNIRAAEARESNKACVKQALSQAVSALNLPVLNQYAASKTGAGSDPARYASQGKN